MNYNIGSASGIIFYGFKKYSVPESTHKWYYSKLKFSIFHSRIQNLKNHCDRKYKTI